MMSIREFQETYKEDLAPYDVKNEMFLLVEHNNVAKLKILLENVDPRPDPNDQNAAGFTPLMLAAKKDSINLIQLLLEEKANVNTQNKKGETALMVAAQNGKAISIQLLIDAKANLNLQRKKEGATALMFAASYGDAPSVRALLAAGANVHIKSTSEKTAEDYADDMDHDLCKKLINDATPKWYSCFFYSQPAPSQKPIEVKESNRTASMKKTGQ